MKKEPCRLCGEPTEFYAKKLTLGKHQVAYFQCSGCGSLQTEKPYWLSESYAAGPGIGNDVGAGQRCMLLSLKLSAYFHILSIDHEQPILDYGAGSGLLTRLMRDRGYNVLAYDKYVTPYFADKFLGAPDSRPWKAILTTEVFEHMEQPAVEIRGFFASNVDYIFFTTELWEGQGIDWWYIDGSQHIFFYTHKGLEKIAQEHGYAFYNLGNLKLFAKQAKISPEDIHGITNTQHIDQLAASLLAEHLKHPFKWVNKDFEIVRGQPISASP